MDPDGNKKEQYRPYKKPILQLPSRHVRLAGDIDEPKALLLQHALLNILPDQLTINLSVADNYNLVLPPSVKDCKRRVLALSVK